MRAKRYLWTPMHEGYAKTINKKVKSRDKNRMYKIDNNMQVLNCKCTYNLQLYNWKFSKLKLSFKSNNKKQN